MITLPETCNAGYDETLLIWNKIVIFGSLVHHYKIASRDISMCENHIPLAIKNCFNSSFNPWLKQLQNRLVFLLYCILDLYDSLWVLDLEA